MKKLNNIVKIASLSLVTFLGAVLAETPPGRPDPA